ncbi:MAG: hypothetical protein QW632_04080 [Ignisphaera sp.]
MFVKTIFPQSRIDIEEVYVRYPIERLDSQAILDFINNRARTIPMDSVSALSKLVKGDLKGFVETFIDTTVCTEVISLCRDRGPRIKCGINITENGVEIYSECFDPELLSHIILGDISMILQVASGYRDFVRFKSVVIPDKLLTQDAITAIEEGILRNKLQTNTATPERSIAKQFYEELTSGGLGYSEAILMAPCLSSTLIEILIDIMKSAAKNYKRVYIATLPPSQENSSFCRIQYKDQLLMYIQLIEEAKKYGFFVCDSEVVSLGAIVDRSQYLISNDFVYNGETFLTPLSDLKYINDYAVYMLKHCLCSNNLLREDRKAIK